MRIKDWHRFQHFKTRRPPWIKLYRDLLDDPEWHELNPISAKYLVMLWLIASENSGSLPCNKKLSFRLRVTEKHLESILSTLNHWLDITAISQRYHSDTPEQDLDLDLDLDKERDISSPGEDGKQDSFSPPDMVRLWNEAIDHYSHDSLVNIPKVMRLTDGRKKKAASRIKDCKLDEPAWRNILNMVHTTPFLSGNKPGVNWKADFDFVVRSVEVVTKIMEGGYS